MSCLLWTEKYRPKSENDLETSEYVKNLLKYAINNDFPHLLLYGPPGCGKTTFALLLKPTLMLNASDERGIDVIRNKIKKIANTVTRQIILLDECENLTKDSQTCLRRILEDYPNTRFIFCTNYVNRIIEPLKSRLLKIKFIARKTDPLEKIGNNEGLCFDKEFYNQLFEKCEGDLRRSINVLQGIKSLKNFILDDLIGRIHDSVIEEFWKIEISNYKSFIENFIRESFSSAELIKQLSDCVKGTDTQKCMFYKALAELENFSIKGCSDELIINALCMKKFEIY